MFGAQHRLCGLLNRDPKTGGGVGACQHSRMNLPYTVRTFAAAVMLTGTLVAAPVAVPTASADPCPDTEVVFARGSGQPVGLGDVGEAFVNSLREQLPDRDISVYPVEYPASTDYHNSAVLGESDASAHIQSTVANCPNTKLVLGGYSQGASVIAMSSNALPPESPTTSSRWHCSAPVESVLHLTVGRSAAGPLLDLPSEGHRLLPGGDIYCEDAGSVVPHLMYVQDGKAIEAAAFAADRVTAAKTAG